MPHVIHHRTNTIDWLVDWLLGWLINASSSIVAIAFLVVVTNARPPRRTARHEHDKESTRKNEKSKKKRGEKVEQKV